MKFMLVIPNTDGNRSIVKVRFKPGTKITPIGGEIKKHVYTDILDQNGNVVQPAIAICCEGTRDQCLLTSLVYRDNYVGEGWPEK